MLTDLTPDEEYEFYANPAHRELRGAPRGRQANESSIAPIGDQATVRDVFAAMPDAGVIEVDFPRSRDLPRSVVFDGCARWAPTSSQGSESAPSAGPSHDPGATAETSTARGY